MGRGWGRKKTGAKSGEEQDTGGKMFPVFLKTDVQYSYVCRNTEFLLMRKIQNSSAKSQNKTRDKAKVLIPMRGSSGKGLM